MSKVDTGLVGQVLDWQLVTAFPLEMMSLVQGQGLVETRSTQSI